ncbi:MAG: CotH kinase family protein, partial [Planctomycetota bacterium]|nr:CotH kinase family protein [Planctomycetota bacterium]
EKAENWAPSPLPANVAKPSGTPGARNSCYSENLPPTITKVTCTPGDPALEQPIRVEADVTDADGVREVALLYRTLTPESTMFPEVSVTMAKTAGNRYAASIPGQNADRLLRYRIKAIDNAGIEHIYPHPNDLRPTLSVWVHQAYKPDRVPFGMVMRFATARSDSRFKVFGSMVAPQTDQPHNKFGPAAALPPRGTSAFVYVDQKTGKPTLFDHINITVRGIALVSQGETNGGYKVHFHKDHTLGGMSSVNLLFEGNERFILAEALSYELFRRAGNPVSMTDFVRVWADGRLVGYHLLMEQPNRSFLRRNKLRDDGNLYKVNWFGNGIAGKHEKKTNTQGNHEDITSIVSKLQQTRGDEQWKIIQENFNVPVFVNYFAINHLVSDWDGSFNNYFVYHDFNGTKKWTIYPWDRDKTWGVYDRLPEDRLFIDMALTNGMDGDRKPPPDGKGGSADDTIAWWRSGGVFSRPMLANPQFRRLFLARTKELLEKVYTEEGFFPAIDAVADRLQDEVRIRAQATSGNPQAGTDRLRQNVQSLKSYLAKRREFLLKQPELQGL